MVRTTNFNAGPAALPLEVLQKAQNEFVDFNGAGMSVMELSHRSKEYDAVHQKAKALLKELMEIPDDYEILFLQGGASLQFSMIPMNFLSKEKTAHFIMTGAWSEKALAEAKLFGSTSVIATSEDDTYKYIPDIPEIPADGAYLHLTSNNTIFGTQWQQFPDSPIPLVADMSSDILSRKIDVSKFGIIYLKRTKKPGPFRGNRRHHQKRPALKRKRTGSENLKILNTC